MYICHYDSLGYRTENSVIWQYANLRTAHFWVITQQVVVRNYHFCLHNNTDESSSQLLSGGSLKSRTVIVRPLVVVVAVLIVVVVVVVVGVVVAAAAAVIIIIIQSSYSWNYFPWTVGDATNWGTFSRHVTYFCHILVKFPQYKIPRKSGQWKQSWPICKHTMQLIKQKPFAFLLRTRPANESPPRGIIHVRILLTVPCGAVTLYVASVS